MFVVLEGIDGAGKTTTARRLAETLTASGRSASVVEKCGTQALVGRQGEQLGALQKLLWGPHAAETFSLMGPEYWCHLMGAWLRATVRFGVQPALDAGHVVIVDSWIGKFAAKMAAHDAVAAKAADAVFACLPEPDLTFYLRVSPQTALQRRGRPLPAESGNPSVAPTAEDFFDFQQRVAAQLDQRAVEHGWRTVSADTLSEAAVVDRLMRDVAAAEVARSRVVLAR